MEFNSNKFQYVSYHANSSSNNDSNASKPHINIFDEKEILRKYVLDTNIKCQWLVLKYECKVYENGKYISSKHSVSSLF